jgi:hypothetical protein
VDADGKPYAELAAIKEREQAATPAPWGTSEDENAWQLSGDLDTGFRPPCLIEAAKYSEHGPSYWPGEADAAFIVAARTTPHSRWQAADGTRPGVTPSRARRSLAATLRHRLQTVSVLLDLSKGTA